MFSFETEAIFFPIANIFLAILKVGRKNDWKNIAFLFQTFLGKIDLFSLEKNLEFPTIYPIIVFSELLAHWVAFLSLSSYIIIYLFLVVSHIFMQINISGICYYRILYCLFSSIIIFCFRNSIEQYPTIEIKTT